MKNNGTGKNDRMDRRSMVKNGTALIGAGFLGSFATPSVEAIRKSQSIIFLMSGILEPRGTEVIMRQCLFVQPLMHV